MKNNIAVGTEEKIFVSQDFSKQSFLGYSFSGCSFEKCDFTETSFEKSSFWDCSFIDCNLSLTDFAKCRMQNVSFKKSRLIGVNFSRCDTSFLFSIHVTQSFARYCNFSALTMESISFQESKIIESKFMDSILKKACFVGADLAGTLFLNCDLREANFQNALNYRIHPCKNNIQKTQFSFPECIGLVKALDVVVVE